MRDPAAARADKLVDLAQAGRATEALEAAEQELAALEPPGHPALHFARAVAYDVLGDHRRSSEAASAGVAASSEDDLTGWWSACLAMHADQSIIVGDEDPIGFDESVLLRELAQAQLAVPPVGDTGARIAAYCTIAGAYARLRLYELAVPMYVRSASTAPGFGDLPAEAVVVQQLNLAALQLTWAMELQHVGLDAEADVHCLQALEHAIAGEHAAAGPHRETWAERCRLFAGCARTQGPDAVDGVEQVRRSLSALDDIGADFERAFSAPLVAMALAAADERAAGLQVVDAALATAGVATDSAVLAATQRARLLLLAPTSEGAQTGLDLGRTLSGAMWRQRARRLSSAEAVLKYERLQAEHTILTRDADIDALTGTAARRALDRRMASLGAQADRESAPVCVLVIDLDKFKNVNDTLGHQVGDDVLRAVGTALRGVLRGEDIVGRFGGDEFVALLCTEAGDGLAVAERMLAAVRAQNWPPALTIRPTLSIGLAVSGADRDLSHTLAAADEAMYCAKRSGGDTVVAAAQTVRAGAAA